MPTARRSRTIATATDELWELICDPHHLPRWWPRVSRVEGVDRGAFTEVMSTRKGHVVRADFEIVQRDEHAHVLRWDQRLAGTPFERVLRSAETELRLTAAASRATDVTIELRQSPAGFFARFGSFMIRRAATHTIDEALDGLARICG